MYHKLPDGQRLYYEYYEHQAGLPTLVFLNGLSQSTVIWLPFVPFFKESCNVLLVDLIFQ